MRLSMTWNDATRQFSIALAAGSRLRGAAPRRIDVRVAGAQTVRSISFDGKPAELTIA